MSAHLSSGGNADVGVAESVGWSKGLSVDVSVSVSVTVGISAIAFVYVSVSVSTGVNKVRMSVLLWV